MTARLPYPCILALAAAVLVAAQREQAAPACGCPWAPMVIKTRSLP